jgi:hypothetical protein
LLSASSIARDREIRKPGRLAERRAAVLGESRRDGRDNSWFLLKLRHDNEPGGLGRLPASPVSRLTASPVRVRDRPGDPRVRRIAAVDQSGRARMPGAAKARSVAD